MLRASGQFPKLARPHLGSRCKLSSEAPKPAAPAAPAAPNPAAVPKAQAPPPPPPPPPKSGGGVIGKLLGLTVLGTGGVVGYSWYDPKFRQQVESNVPYSKEALQYVFDNLPEVYKPTQEPVVKKAAIPDDQPQSLLKKKPVQEKEKPKEVLASPEELAEQEKKAAAKRREQEEQAAAKRQEQEDKRLAALKRMEEERVAALRLQQQKEEENRIRRQIAEKQAEEAAEEAAENAALEAVLAQTGTETGDVVRGAMEAQHAAASITRLHSEMLKKAMDDAAKESGPEDDWAEVAKVYDERQAATADANRRAEDAKLWLEKLRTALRDGRESELTQQNAALGQAEELLSRLQYDLTTATAGLVKAESESRVMREYRELVKKGKEQFKKELESVLPEVKLGKRFGGKLSEDELNSLIAHAHKRVEQLQRQLAAQQLLEAQHIEAALATQHSELDKMAADDQRREAERQKADFDREKMQWDAAAAVAQEKEMRAALARQAAAHSDHLAQVLRVQERELEGQFEQLLGHRLLQERDAFKNEVAGWVGRLRGIESAVEARADQEKKGRKAQELWLACQALQNLIALGNPEGGYFPESQLQPIKEELVAIKEASDSHPFVTTVIEAVPEDAAARGVWTEEALVERFDKVNSICRRVAMIDQTGGSLFRYFLSYMQALLVFASKPLSVNDEIERDGLDTFKILDNAKYHLEKGDMEQALRFMNQLRGESRVAARDWIREARLLLETRQAAYALLAHASAEGLGSLA